MEQNSAHTRAHAHMAERQIGKRQARSRWELADLLSEVHSARINTMLFVFSLKGCSLCLFATSRTFTQNFWVNHVSRTSLGLFLDLLLAEELKPDRARKTPQGWENSLSTFSSFNRIKIVLTSEKKENFIVFIWIHWTSYTTIISDINISLEQFKGIMCFSILFCNNNSVINWSFDRAHMCVIIFRHSSPSCLLKPRPPFCGWLTGQSWWRFIRMEGRFLVGCVLPVVGLRWPDCPVPGLLQADGRSRLDSELLVSFPGEHPGGISKCHHICSWCGEAEAPLLLPLSKGDPATLRRKLPGSPSVNLWKVNSHI